MPWDSELLKIIVETARQLLSLSKLVRLNVSSIQFGAAEGFFSLFFKDV